MKKPEEYICINQPRWAREDHDDDDDDDDDESENANEWEDADDDEDGKSGNVANGTGTEEDKDNRDKNDKGNQGAESSAKPSSDVKMWPKPASEHPEWKWTMMWRSWQMLCDYSVRAKYTIPDYFDMYIYNDFHGYGMIELAENAIVEFHKEYSKKDGSLHLMWAPVAMLGHWLLASSLDEIMQVDDAERVGQLISLMGTALLTALHAIDRAGKLGKDSEFRDLGLVMAVYLKWSAGLDAYGFEEEDNHWREHVFSYAEKAGIDLTTIGAGSELEDIDDAKPLEKSKKADRWEWKKALAAYKKDHGSRGKIGGQDFDITKWSSKERKEHHFDGQDPLKDVPADALKENRLDLG